MSSLRPPLVTAPCHCEQGRSNVQVSRSSGSLTWEGQAHLGTVHICSGPQPAGAAGCWWPRLGPGHCCRSSPGFELPPHGTQGGGNNTMHIPPFIS